MARFAISTDRALGISVPDLRGVAKQIGRDHELALQLWSSGIHEARILASMVDDPKLVTGDQMDVWVRDFDSWDVCDQCCSNLFDKTTAAYEKVVLWSSMKEEFVKRAGFAMMAALAAHDKKASDVKFLGFLPIIERESVDERNFVKKAVNWALRGIGKRNPRLNKAAVQTARRMAKVDSRASRWVASDALRELTGAAVQERLSR
jgi:3-methyladenine DNA glycosylase AlkD